MNFKAAIDRADGHAPYLAESLELYPELAARLQVESPENIFAALIAEIPDPVDDLDSEMTRLRILKRRVHLVIALADIAETWSWVEVTEYLSQLADFCMQRLLRCAGELAGIAGTPENPVPGLFALAVGKYGARELNYSSDIDFNVFYDPEKIVLPNPARAERTLIKVVQSLIKGFERITGEGYIFRTDLRLRPDPRSNAVAVSTHTAERYYETLGQNWERAAMIKARVCGGDFTAGQDFIDEVLSPFIWRRNLDYAAIEDILAIKRQIHAGKGGMKIHIPGHHLKLGKGGIREIEFYAQVQQLILGGRLPELRVLRTIDALAALSKGGFISADDAKALTEHYAVLRKWEHRTQMVNDAQTHHVPEDETERENFARLCGFKTRGDLDAEVLHVLTDVHERYVGLFPDVETLSSREGNLVFTGVDADPATLRTLERLGYERGPDVWQEMASWLGGRIRATKTERAREYLTALAPRLIDYCADTGQPDVAFAAFSRFFTVVSGGVSLLSMFNQEPERLAYLISLMTRSAQVADMLADRPAILDAMADPEFLDLHAEGFAQDYIDEIAQTEGFEDALNAARRRVREDHFRITAAVLSKRIDLSVAPSLFTSIADQTVAALLPVAIQEVERVAGPVRGDVAIIGLGKMGGREMRLLSDLDVMLIYSPANDEENPQRLYTKVTQRLVSALSAVTEEGGLFEVDMALRPSGRSGPVAVTVDSFARYYAESAWTWEYMALTRARVIASTGEVFKSQLESVIHTALNEPRSDLNMPVDIADMLSRTKDEKKPKGIWDVKNSGGGLRDIEFIAQSLFLKDRTEFSKSQNFDTLGMLKQAEKLKLIPAKTLTTLQNAALFYQNLGQALSLILGDDLPQMDREVASAADIMGYPNGERLEADLQAHMLNVKKLTKKYIFDAA